MFRRSTTCSFIYLLFFFAMVVYALREHPPDRCGTGRQSYFRERKLDAGHSATAFVLRPTAFLARGTVRVDGTHGDRHLSGNEIADAVSSFGPFHLRASVSWNVPFLQTWQSRFSVDSHQFTIHLFDATPLGSFCESVGAKAVVSPFIHSTTTCRKSGGNARSLLGAHGESIVRVSEVAVGTVLESILENFSLHVLHVSSMYRGVMRDAHRHLATFLRLPRRQAKQNKGAE